MLDDMPVWIDGEIRPESEVHIPLTSSAHLFGYNVFDLLRTVHHEPFDVANHVDRFRRSCRGAGITLEPDDDGLRQRIDTVADATAADLPAETDFLITMLASADEPRLLVFPREIHFANNAAHYLEGCSLATSPVRQPPPATLPPQLKHCARLHHRLAGQRAGSGSHDTLTLLLDHQGRVAEATGANIFAVRDGELVTPPTDHILPGTARKRTIAVAEADDVPVHERHIQLHDLAHADEIFFTNTSHLLAPIVEVDGVPVADGRPGPLTEHVLDLHSDAAGIDIVEQYVRHLPSEEQPAHARLGGDAGVRDHGGT